MKRLIITADWSNKMAQDVHKSKHGMYRAVWIPAKNHYSISFGVNSSNSQVAWFTFNMTIQAFAIEFGDGFRFHPITPYQLAELSALCNRLRHEFPKLTKTKK